MEPNNDFADMHDETLPEYTVVRNSVNHLDLRPEEGNQVIVSAMEIAPSNLDEANRYLLALEALAMAFKSCEWPATAKPDRVPAVHVVIAVDSDGKPGENR